MFTTNFNSFVARYCFHVTFLFHGCNSNANNIFKVQNQLPNADQVEKLEKKDLVMYIHVGKPNEEFSKKFGNEARIQLNDKFADVKDIKPFVAAERAARRGASS